MRRIASVIRCYVCRTTWNSIRIPSVSDTSNEHNVPTHTQKRKKKRKKEKKFHASKRCIRFHQKKQDRANFFPRAITRVQSQSGCIRGRFVDKSPWRNRVPYGFYFSTLLGKFSGLIIEELTGPAVNWCKNSAASFERNFAPFRVSRVCRSIFHREYHPASVELSSKIGKNGSCRFTNGARDSFDRSIGIKKEEF